MMRTRILLAIFLLMFNSLYAENVDVTVIVPEDYGIDFPSALHIDRLYFAMENEQGDLELLTESDIDV